MFKTMLIHSVSMIINFIIAFIVSIIIAIIIKMFKNVKHHDIINVKTKHIEDIEKKQ